jgi:diguanylate cyclase (GGDEF)-like protein
VVDDIARSKWVTDSSGVADVWSAFIAIPVHVDGAIYGAVGFANAARRAKPLDEADLAFVRLVGVLTGSAIERGRQRDQLDELAFFDALTGLPNRLLLHKRLEAQLRSAEASGSRFALEFLDLDDFKSINDTHGHAAGDATLRELGRRLAMAVRADDTVARLGGDEFVVLLPAAEPERVRDTEERIRAIFDEPFAVDGHYHRLGASIGVSYYPADGSTAGALLRAADRELYRVKAERARIA